MTHNTYHLLPHAILLEEALRVGGGRVRLVIIGRGREFQFISSSGVRFLPSSWRVCVCWGISSWEIIGCWRIRGSKCLRKCSVVGSLPLALGLLIGGVAAYVASWLNDFGFACIVSLCVLKRLDEKRARFVEF